MDLPSLEVLPVFGLVCHWCTEDHEAPFRVRIRIPFLLVDGGFGRHVRAGCFVVTTKVALDEVALLQGVLDWIAVVAARHLDYLVEADMVELASLLPVDPIDCHNELTIAAPPAILLSFSPSIAVLSLVC